MKKKYLLISLFPLLVGCARSVNNSQVIEGYYMPFNIETYGAVTIENIENHGEYTKFFLNNKEYNQICGIIDNATKSTSDGQVIRLKMFMPNGEILYLDRNAYIFTKNSIKKLNEHDFKDFKNILGLKDVHSWVRDSSKVKTK